MGVRRWWRQPAVVVLCISARCGAQASVVKTAFLPCTHSRRQVQCRLERQQLGWRQQEALVRPECGSVTTRGKSRAEDVGNEWQNLPQTFVEKLRESAQIAGVSAALVSGLVSGMSMPPPAAMAADTGAVGICLIQKCTTQLARCIADPKCLANVICINTCVGRPDESECQIRCGNLWENDVVGIFNKCAVSDRDCVPQRQDDGRYPVPQPAAVVPSFNTKLFNGRWYITAGQNPLFDTFPCQVHFFTETSTPGKFFGKLNWRIEEPDGEFFTRDAIQRFIQDPAQPGHLLNHDNEYLHYEDDWYVLDYAYDDNKDGVPPFAFIYYRGSNDAWVGYGGAVVYTRDNVLPESLVPRLRTAAAKVGFDFDKDFMRTDNSCKKESGEPLLLREKFAGKVAIQTEQQLLQQATIIRRNAVNTLEKDLETTERAVQILGKRTQEFEKEIVQDVEREAESIEKEVSREAMALERALEGKRN